MIGCIILWEQIEGLAAIISSIARSAGVGTVVDVGAGQVHLYPAFDLNLLLLSLLLLLILLLFCPDWSLL